MSKNPHDCLIGSVTETYTSGALVENTVRSIMFWKNYGVVVPSMFTSNGSIAHVADYLKSLPHLAKSLNRELKGTKTTIKVELWSKDKMVVVNCVKLDVDKIIEKLNHAVATCALGEVNGC